MKSKTQFLQTSQTQQKKFLQMSISISTLSSVFIEFVSQTFIPIIDKNKSNYLLSISKWQEFIDSVLKKISNFHSDDELKQRLHYILYKFSIKEKTEKYSEDAQQTSFGERPSLNRVNFTENQKLKLKQQQESNGIENKQKQETIQFRDRKTSLDEYSGRKEKKQQQQYSRRKDDRTGSVHLLNGIDGDSMSQVPLMGSPTQIQSRHKNGSYIRKQNQVMSFNSISDYHRSRNNISMVGRQSKQVHPQTGQIKIASRKSIQDLGVILTQQQGNKGNSYSSNYIQSMKKIGLEARSTNDKVKVGVSGGGVGYSNQGDDGNELGEMTPVKVGEGGGQGQQQSQQVQQSLPQQVQQSLPLSQNQHSSSIVVSSGLSSIKKKISQGSQFIGSPSSSMNHSGAIPPPALNVSPPLTPTSLTTPDSFGKLLNSFKKLCNTFESNHHKLMREDFNNKYINC